MSRTVAVHDPPIQAPDNSPAGNPDALASPPPAPDADISSQPSLHARLQALEAALAAERQARLAAELRLEQAVAATRAEDEEDRRRLEERLLVLAGARCLLWHAEVRHLDGVDPETDPEGGLRWDIRFASPEAAARFLPIHVEPGQSFAYAWWYSRPPRDQAETDRIGRAATREGRDYEVEYRCRLADGSIRWIQEDVQVEVVEAGRRWRCVGVCTDVTERKRIEEEMRDLNVRLRRAMTETHHRVRNNLQILTGMIELHADAGQETVPAGEFSRLSRHVQALAAIHTILTEQSRSGGESRVVPIRRMLETLLPLYQKAAPSHAVSVESDDVQLPGRQATALALVVNELVSNAIKHGRSEVRVTFTRLERRARLQVEDDGDGFGTDFVPERAANTGLELVSSLVGWDLQGQAEYADCPNGGGRVTVEFPLTAT